MKLNRKKWETTAIVRTAEKTRRGIRIGVTTTSIQLPSYYMQSDPMTMTFPVWELNCVFVGMPGEKQRRNPGGVIVSRGGCDAYPKGV